LFAPLRIGAVQGMISPRTLVRLRHVDTTGRWTFAKWAMSCIVSVGSFIVGLGSREYARELHYAFYRGAGVGHGARAGRLPRRVTGSVRHQDLARRGAVADREVARVDRAGHRNVAGDREVRRAQLASTRNHPVLREVGVGEVGAQGGYEVEGQALDDLGA
jgi:hypothetical protein